MEFCRKLPLLDKESTRRMEFHQDLLGHSRGFRPARSKILVTVPGTFTLEDLHCVTLIFKNLNTKTSLKLKIWSRNFKKNFTK
jgi:hypothetical protein